MTNTQMHPVKRIITFIMALLMTMSSFVYMRMPAVDAAANTALNSNNWRGWYECFLSSMSSMDAQANLIVPTHGSNMIAANFNPLRFSGGTLVSIDTNTNAGWDDFVAVASNASVPVSKYSMTLNIVTGGTKQIADVNGNGSFSIAALSTMSISTTPFTNYLWGTGYGLAGSKGYVINFTASAGSKTYYDYYTISFTDSDGNYTVLKEKENLTSNLVMADGTKPITLSFNRVAANTYDIVLTNSDNVSQKLLTNRTIPDSQFFYYGAGAFCSGLNLGVDSSGNVLSKLDTSPAFLISSVSDCVGSHSPADLTGAHNYSWIDRNTYEVEKCTGCDTYRNKKYNVTYDANGGSGAPDSYPKEFSCNGNPDVTGKINISSTVPTKNGYEFKGWLCSYDNNVYQPGESVSVPGHVTFTAQWGVKTYTIALNTNGGTMTSGHRSQYTDVAYGTTYTSLFGTFPQASRTGYTFNNWKLDGSTFVLTNTAMGNTVTQSGTFTAQWTPITYKVKYNAGGGSGTMADSTFTYDVSGNLRTNSFTKEGYTFAGWKDGNGNSYTDGQSVSNLAATNGAQIILTAQWTVNRYTLNFNLAGGTMTSGHSTQYTVEHGKTFTQLLNSCPTATKTGHIFDGWKLDGYDFYLSSSTMGDPITQSGTFTAQWTPITYTIKFNAGDGGSGSISDMTCRYGTTYTLPVNTFTNTGYTFAGWKDGNGNSYTDGQSVSNLTVTNGDVITLTAQWAEVLYTMTLDPVDGTLPAGYSSTYQVYYGKPFPDICAFPEAAKTGYHLDYWECYRNGTVYIANYTRDNWSTSKYNADYDATLKAYFTPEQYTITLVPGDGAVCSPTSFVVTYDSAYSDLPTPTKAGYTFMGWYTGSNGTGTKIENTTICKIAGDDTLYAHWQSEPYTLTFDANGGSLSTSKYTNLTNAGDGKYTVTLYYGDSYTDKIYETVPIPTWLTHPKRQYRFDGWSLTPDGEVFWKPDSLDDWEASTYPGGDITVYAKWTYLNSYKLTFDLNDGESGEAKMPTEYTGFIYTVYDGELLNTVFGTHNNKVNPFPMPTRPGYKFLYWELVNASGETTGEKWYNEWGTNQSYHWGQNVTMRAVWDFETYEITFDPNGGTMPNGCTTGPYSVQYTKSVNTAVGAYPVPTLDGYLFKGWVAYEDTQYEYTWEEGTQWNYHYVTDAVLVAKWGVDAATVTFHADHGNCKQVYYNYYSFDSSGDPVYIEDPASFDSTGATVKNRTSYEINITKGQKYSAIEPDYPTATLDGYVLEYWYGIDANGKKVRIWPSEWASEKFDQDADLDLYAYYRCDHKQHGDYTWEYTRVYNDDNSLVYHNAPLDMTNADFGNYYRHHGICQNCNKIVAFGYEVDFLARDNYSFTYSPILGPREIYINTGVPVYDQFTYNKCGYISNNEGPDGHSFIVDYLDDDLNPEITVHFDPILKAAKSDDGWISWEVDYTRFGYRSDNSGGWRNQNYFFNGGPKTLTWAFDYKDRSFDGDGKLTSCHLRLVPGYDGGEMLFDSSVLVHSSGTLNSCEIVDSGYRYGILPIKEGQSYNTLLKYIPVGKQLATYPTPFEYVDRSGATRSYVNANKTLYCSIGWHYSGFVLDSATWSAKYNVETLHNDCKVDSYFITSSNDSQQSIAEGTLATFYANNKMASETYNKAYYSFAEDSGGTMFYKYYIKNDAWVCEPLFKYDPSNPYDFTDICNEHDVTMADIRLCYPIGDSSKAQVSSVVTNSIMTFDPEADFDYTAYKSGVSVIIAKEPKRYTYYMGKGVHYVFPQPVNDPYGVPYTAYTGDFSYTDGGQTKDPYISDKYITDTNGNSYYINIDVDGNGTQGNFLLTRSSSGVPVAGQFNKHANWKSYTGSENGTLPLGYAMGLYRCPIDDVSLGEPVRPYGDGEIKYWPAAGFEDYYAEYGNDDLYLSYPDGKGITVFHQGATPILDDDMQASFYTSWDFAVKFNSNYPTGKTHDGIGYPTAAIGQKTQDGVTVSSSDIKKTGNNHYVYAYLHMFKDNNMPGRNLFTCDGYYIDQWQLYDKNGNPVKDSEGNYIILKALDKKSYDGMSIKEMEQYQLSSYYASRYAQEPGAEFRAVWKRAIKLRIVEGGSGADPFATVNYKSVYTGADETLYPNSTTEVMVRENTFVNLGSFKPASNNVYSFLTLNNNKFKDNADRILTNRGSYSFYIIDDTALTVQFIPTGSSTGFFIDRSNKLLRTDNDPWKLYDGSGTGRNNTGVAGSSITTARYYMYDSTNTYEVNVEGSTVATFNKTYNGCYDEVIPLVTGAMSGNSSFVGWTLNDKFVCYDLVYRHRITGTGTVKAVYSGTAGPVINIDYHGTDSDGRDYYLSHYALPSGCTLNESGFIYTTLNDSEIRIDDLVSGTESYYGKVVSTNDDSYGNFKLMLPDGNTYYVVAYLSYTDAEGKLQIVYSSRVNN